MTGWLGRQVAPAHPSSLGLLRAERKSLSMPTPGGPAEVHGRVRRTGLHQHGQPSQGQRCVDPGECVSRGHVSVAAVVEVVL